MEEQRRAEQPARLEAAGCLKRRGAGCGSTVSGGDRPSNRPAAIYEFCFGAHARSLVGDHGRKVSISESKIRRLTCRWRGAHVRAAAILFRDRVRLSRKFLAGFAAEG